MKQKFLIAAGLLALGASPAFAFTIPAMKPDMAKAVKQIWTDQMAAEQASTSSTSAAVVDKAALDLPTKIDPTFVKADETLAKAGDMPAKAGERLAAAGPSEPVLQPKLLPAAVAYPACSRTVTDHCIQLYEPGVRAQLAEWNRSAAGTATAMGGPYEPVDTTLAGEMGNAGAAPAAYPPCSRTVTDRCIQLYERGVRR